MSSICGSFPPGPDHGPPGGCWRKLADPFHCWPAPGSNGKEGSSATMAAAVGGFRTGRGGARPRVVEKRDQACAGQPAAVDVLTGGRSLPASRAGASGSPRCRTRAITDPSAPPDRPVDRCAMPAASDWRAPDRRAEPERQSSSAWATRSPFAVSGMSDVPVCSPERRQADSPWRITTTSPAESAWIVMDGWPARRSVACSLIPTPPDAGHGGDGPGRG